MAKNTKDTTVVKEKETKRFPWGRVLGAILLLAFLVWLGFKAVNWFDARMARNTEMAVTKALAEMQANQPETVAPETEDVTMIGSVSDPDLDTYFPELSCSDLASCTMNEVPEGYFTIGFTGTAEGCDWVLFNEGETIDFTGLDEIHTYNVLLPLTRLEGFVLSQTPWVFACQIH